MQEVETARVVGDPRRGSALDRGSVDVTVVGGQMIRLRAASRTWSLLIGSAPSRGTCLNSTVGWRSSRQSSPFPFSSSPWPSGVQLGASSKTELLVYTSCAEPSSTPAAHTCVRWPAPSWRPDPIDQLGLSDIALLVVAAA